MKFAIILHSEPKVGGWKESQIRDVHQFPIDTYYFYRAKKHSEPKVGGWKESQIRNNT